MRLILRIAGTWLIGLALVLLVIDGTRSLSANALRLTSLGDAWLGLHAPSLDAVQQFLSSRLFAELLDTGLVQILSYPAFAVAVVPGIGLALLGRVPRRERFVRQDLV